MKIKVMNYRGIAEEIDLGDISDLDFLLVTVMSGDEIVDIYHRDRQYGDPCRGKHIDVFGDGRHVDFLDAIYKVAPEEIQDWSNRESSYYYQRSSVDRLSGLYFNARD